MYLTICCARMLDVCDGCRCICTVVWRSEDNLGSWVLGIEFRLSWRVLSPSHLCSPSQHSYTTRLCASLRLKIHSPEAGVGLDASKVRVRQKNVKDSKVSSETCLTGSRRRGASDAQGTGSSAPPQRKCLGQEEDSTVFLTGFLHYILRNC